MHRFFPFMLAIVMLLGANTAQAADNPGKRVALVIGNAAYPQPLLNPANDARAMAERLRRLGFEVQLKLDVNAAQLQKPRPNFPVPRAAPRWR